MIMNRTTSSIDCQSTLVIPLNRFGPVDHPTLGSAFQPIFNPPHWLPTTPHLISFIEGLIMGDSGENFTKVKVDDTDCCLLI